MYNKIQQTQQLKRIWVIWANNNKTKKKESNHRMTDPSQRISADRIIIRDNEAMDKVLERNPKSNRISKKDPLIYQIAFIIL